MTLGGSMREATRRYGAFLLTTWSAGWRITIGLLLFVIPGLYLAVRYSVALPVTAFEGLVGRDAIERSHQLVRGHGWRIFFYAVAAVLLLVGLAILPSIFLPDDASPVLEAIAAIPAQPMTVLLEIGAALLYLDVTGTGEHRPARGLRAGDAAVSTGRGLVAASVATIVMTFTASVIWLLLTDPALDVENYAAEPPSHAGTVE